MKKPTISVIGLGYVGLPVSIVFDEAGYNVIGFDLTLLKPNLSVIDLIIPFKKK